MKDKQEITKVMLLTLVYNVKERKTRKIPGLSGLGWNYEGVEETVEKYENFVLPLENFDVIEENTQNLLILKTDEELKIPKRKYVKAALSLTNDPKITFAGDWSDLGCFRLVYKIFKPTINVMKNKVIISSVRNEEKKDYGKDRDLTVPDRVRWK